MRSLATLAAATVAALAPAATAGAVTFGADLSTAPNVAFDCTVTPPVGWMQVPSGAQTCTWWTTGRLTDTSEGHVVPYGGGVVTRARVRVGPVTGPMQFVVMRSLRHPQSLADPACCFPVGASEVFTPAPNAVTEVPMNVRVRHDTDPATGINNYDHIAISVLEPGVPIPAYFTGDQSLSAPTGGGFYPAYVPGTERTTGMFGVVGFQTLINADLEPLPDDAPPAGNPTGPTDVSGLIGIGDGRARLGDGAAAIPLACRSAQECAGLVRLLGAPAGRTAAASARRVLYGKARFEIAAGATARVKVRLTTAGRRALGGRRRARVQLTATIDGRRALSRRVVLRRG